MVEDDSLGMQRGTPRRLLWLMAAVAVGVCGVVAVVARDSSEGAERAAAVSEAGIHKIKHVIVVMQENRSFDAYFGTYPGADGIPMRDGHPAACIPDPQLGHCVRPFHDPRQVSGHGGLRNSEEAAKKDIDGGRMDGFLRYPKRCHGCVPARPFAMGYKNASDIPLYWRLAHRYVLQDHMFESSLAWSLPSHLYMVSAWSAECHTPNPFSCRAYQKYPAQHGPFAWTDITYLLARHHVSWGYYITPGWSPDCPVQNHCKLVRMSPHHGTIWNPLPRFSTVRADHQLGDIRTTAKFFRAAAAGTLPSVSWVIPNSVTSEHPPATTVAGQRWVARVIDAVMHSPDWKSTAIFISWDDWGGFYDHVVPPKVDGQGYGLRVPGLVVSPYARTGYVDHQVLSFDAYLKFIEDDFLGKRRLNPRTDGRPDPRPTVRESVPLLGNLVKDFNFNQRPRPARSVGGYVPR